MFGWFKLETARASQWMFRWAYRKVLGQLLKRQVSVPPFTEHLDALVSQWIAILEISPNGSENVIFAL